MSNWLRRALVAGVIALGAVLPNDAVAVADGVPVALIARDLRCEYTVDPLGVDVTNPRLSWSLASTVQGDRQVAYQIVAASSLSGLAGNAGALWDSGKVASDATLFVPYAGRSLASSQQVFWKVRVWDREGRASAWSQAATWTMGLLTAEEWRSRWIADAGNGETVLLRREFEVKPGLRRALVHLTGLGQYELQVNGATGQDDVLSPGWTKYDKTCLYDTRDLTRLVRPGRNALGLFLGNGMYRVHAGRYTKFTGSFGQLMAILQLRLEYGDGTVETIGSDTRWRTHAGPITFSSIYGGEDFDARLDPKGWSAPGFDDRDWQEAVVVGGPGGLLKGQTTAAPPIRTFEALPVHDQSHHGDRIVVYDTGQNVSLVIKARVHGPRGSYIRVTPAELLKADGTVDRESVGGGEAYWQYTLANGAQPEFWSSHFYYHGSRYLQVERFPAVTGGALPEVDELQALVVQSASPPIGSFESSSELFNQIHRLVRWAQRSNMVSVLTDCPHRERLGWLEQYHLNGPSLRYGFDLSRLYRKGMGDMADSQLSNGLVPDIAPEYTVFEGGFRDSPEWGSAYLLAGWQQYVWTGDLDLLRSHYDGMARYVGYLGSKASGHIVSHGLGDWYDIGPDRPGYAQLTPIPLTATAFYFEDATILARVAALLGRPDDEARYTKLAGEIRTAFNARFFEPSTHRYATGSQVANAIPLVMGLVDPGVAGAILDAVVADIRQHGNALTAGDVGYRYLLRALADGGRSDVIFDMNNQSEKPGYGYQLKMGATSLTEAWNADPRSSQNHFMLGQIVEWFYGDLAGIAPDPAAAAFKHVVIAPQPVGDLTWVKAHVDTPRGTVASEWTQRDGVFRLEVTIPPNTTATIAVPAESPADVSTAGGTSDAQPALSASARRPGRVLYETPSGRWVFTAKR